MKRAPVIPVAAAAVARRMGGPAVMAVLVTQRAAGVGTAPLAAARVALLAIAETVELRVLAALARCRAMTV